MSQTTVHLSSGEHVEVEGTREGVAAQLTEGRGLVTIGDITINPAHVTHLHETQPRSRKRASFSG